MHINEWNGTSWGKSERYFTTEEIKAARAEARNAQAEMEAMREAERLPHSPNYMRHMNLRKAWEGPKDV